MSLFTRAYYTPEPSFNSLFRLLNDFDNYSRDVSGQNHHGRHSRHHVRTFNPRFDVKETEENYELHGELPGIEKDNVQIEFTEPQTLVIRGRVERTYSAGTPPAVEDNQVSGAITEGSEKSDDAASHKSHQATVEDEDATEGTTTEQPTPATTNAEVVKAGDEKPQEPAKPSAKYWVSERSVGEFSRTFNFPTRVEQDAVSANLNNGVLSVIVPKAKKHEARRINIA